MHKYCRERLRKYISLYLYYHSKYSVLLTQERTILIYFNEEQRKFFQLPGKTTLVPACSHGIGKAMAACLVVDGANIISVSTLLPRLTLCMGSNYLFT